MDKFNLDELLRHAYSGAIFVATLAFLCFPAGLHKPSGDNFAAAVTASIGIVIVVGTLVYVLHRATVYPVLYWVGLKLAWRDAPKKMVDVDLDRFVRRNTQSSVQKYLNEWGSQVHLLYCATWSTLLAFPAASLWHDKWNYSDPKWAIDSTAKCVAYGFAAVTLLSAIVHHSRLLRWEREVAKRESPVANA